MNDHHLDDLIIGDPQPVTNQSRGILTIIALLIVVLIAGLILWALLFNSSEETSHAATQNTSKTRTLDPNLIPLENNTSETKPKQSDVTPMPDLKQNPSDKPEEKPMTKPAAVKNLITVKPAPVDHPKPQKPKTTPKPNIPKVQKPYVTTETASKKKAGTVLIKNADKTIYYIQVGAFRHKPNPKFLKKLKDNGFTFITKKTDDLRRVRVGPYDSRDEARAALPEIKTKLGIDGIIVKF